MSDPLEGRLVRLIRSAAEWETRLGHSPTDAEELACVVLGTAQPNMGQTVLALLAPDGYPRFVILSQYRLQELRQGHLVGCNKVEVDLHGEVYAGQPLTVQVVRAV